MTEAAALTPVVGGPNYRTVGVRGVRQSTMLHLQGHTAHRAKHTGNQYYSLQELGWPLTSTGGASQKGHSKSYSSSVQYQKWSHPRSSSIRSLPASLSTNRLSPVGQDSNTHNFLPSYPNCVLFDSWLPGRVKTN